MRVSGWALACLTAIISFTSAVPTASAQADKPNIVLVFMDNFGWGEPGFNGGGIIRGAPTPRLDQLAAEGLRLTNFNIEVQCTPSRSALMTGRYAIRSGNGAVPLGEGVYGLVQWEVTMAEMLSEAGYATGMYGKWHLGRTKGRFPTDQGFDEWYGIPNTTDESVYSSLPGFAESGLAQTYVLDAKKGETPRQAQPYNLDYRPLIDRDLTDRAITFIRRQAESETPFFVYLPYTATHFPTMPHPDFAGKSGRGLWGDMLMQIDSYVGELVDTVDGLGIAENTIFIFTTDNGSSSGWKIHNSGMRAGKGSEYDGGHRVPMFLHWPKGGFTGGRDIEPITAHVDIAPTLLELAGVSPPQSMQGQSLISQLNSPTLPERWVYSSGVKRKRNLLSVQNERYKMIVNTKNEWVTLYDLQQDPAETTDVSAREPELVTALRARITARSKALNAMNLLPVLSDDVDPAIIEELRALGYLRD